MTQALKYVRKGFAHDEFAKQRAKKFLSKGGLSDFERKFVRARILHEGRQFQVRARVRVYVCVCARVLMRTVRVCVCVCVVCACACASCALCACVCVTLRVVCTTQLALEMVDQAEAMATTDEDRACVAFIRGDALRELKRYDEAEQAFTVLLFPPAN
jgi:hypothetical protein